MKKYTLHLSHNDMPKKFHAVKLLNFLKAKKKNKKKKSLIHCRSYHYYHIAYTREGKTKKQSCTWGMFKLLLFCILHFAQDDNVWCAFLQFSLRMNVFLSHYPNDSKFEDTNWYYLYVFHSFVIAKTTFLALCFQQSWRNVSNVRDTFKSLVDVCIDTK